MDMTEETAPATTGSTSGTTHQAKSKATKGIRKTGKGSKSDKNSKTGKGSKAGKNRKKKKASESQADPDIGLVSSETGPALALPEVEVEPSAGSKRPAADTPDSGPVSKRRRAEDADAQSKKTKKKAKKAGRKKAVVSESVGTELDADEVLSAAVGIADDNQNMDMDMDIDMDAMVESGAGAGASPSMDHAALNPPVADSGAQEDDLLGGLGVPAEGEAADEFATDVAKRLENTGMDNEFFFTARVTAAKQLVSFMKQILKGLRQSDSPKAQVKMILRITNKYMSLISITKQAAYMYGRLQWPCDATLEASVPRDKGVVVFVDLGKLIQSIEFFSRSMDEVVVVMREDDNKLTIAGGAREQQDMAITLSAPLLEGDDVDPEEEEEYVLGLKT